MEILFVTRPIVPPWNEGSKNLTWQLASHLTRHTPHLLTTDIGERPYSPHIKWYGIYSRTSLTMGQKLRLLRCLAMKPPAVDIFHFYFVPTLLTSRIFSAISRYYGKKSVQTIPCLPANLPTPSKIRELIFADHVVVYSQYTRNKLAEWGVTNVTKIDVGLEIKRFAEAKSDLHLRQRLGLCDDDVLILFAGEYYRLAGVTALKRIMLELIKKCSRCHFLIACRILSPDDLLVEADLKQTVRKQQIHNQVHFIEEVTDFASLLKTSDIFFYPVTDMKGKIDTPLVMLEAMASGLPVVTHDLSPLNEIFDNVNLSCVADDETSIERLLLLVQDRALRQRDGDHLQSIVQKRHDLSKMVESYEVIYDTLC
jgi:glycosyltransferase involved in cell wall biosynthesis